MDDQITIFVGFFGVFLGAFVAPLAQYLWDLGQKPKFNVLPVPALKGRKDGTLRYHSILIKNVGENAATKCSVWLIVNDSQGIEIVKTRIALTEPDTLDEGIIYPDTHTVVQIIEVDLLENPSGPRIQFYGRPSSITIQLASVSFPLDITIKIYCLETKSTSVKFILRSKDEYLMSIDEVEEIALVNK